MGVPSWCGWFDEDDWAYFRWLLETDIKDEQGNPLRVGTEPTVWLTARDGHRYEQDVAAIADHLRGLPRPQWRDAVLEFFRWQAEAAELAREMLEGDFEQFRRRIVPRVDWPGHRPPDEDALQRSLGAGFTAALIVPVEGGTLTVRPHHARGWGREIAELWAVGLHNLRQEPVRVMRAPRPEFEFSVLGGETLNFSANLLRLEELVGRTCPYGVYVIIPHDYILGFLPLRDLKTFAEMLGLREEAERLATNLQKHGGHTSPDVFWWADGYLDRLDVPPIPEEDNTPDNPILLSLPPRLMAVYERLMAAEGGR